MSGDLTTWEFVPRGEWRSAEPMPEGTASLHRDGMLVFHGGELRAVGIDRFAAVLAQVTTLRLGFRQPKEHEQAGAVSVGKIVADRGRDTGRRAIRVNRALRLLGLDARKIAPLRIELKVVNDALLIADLAAVEFADQAAGDEPKRTGRATT